jgi:hypothetical protein
MTHDARIDGIRKGGRTILEESTFRLSMANV